MKKKQYFEYREATVEFLPYDVTFLGSRRPVTSSLLLSFILSISLILSGITPNMQYWFLKMQNKNLSSDLAYFIGTYTHIEDKLISINYNDREIYRSILNVAPIDPAVWDAGKGGDIRKYGFTKDLSYKLAIKSEKLKYQMDLQKSSFDQVKNLAMKRMKELRAIPSFKPIVGEVICGFNPDGKGVVRNHRNKRYQKPCSYKHQGVDIPAKIGTQVYAAADGIVRAAGWNYSEWGYGIQLVIDHGNGYVTRYAHLSFAKAQIGLKVKRGDVIAYSGTSGMSTGPHLHYEVIKNHKHVDPSAYFLLNIEEIKDQIQ